MVNDTTITAVSPAGANIVDVTVTTLGGTSATSPADQFSYLPVVTSVTPRSGPLAGGTEVIITGTNFASPRHSRLRHDAGHRDYPASDDPRYWPSVLRARAPGIVNVTVVAGGGTSATSSADLFFYTAIGAVRPTVAGISPAFGSPDGGTSVTITGTGFDQTNPALVFFGTVAATSVTVTSSTTISAVSPAGTGTVDVTVTTYGGTSPTTSADQFTYTMDGPQVTNVQRLWVPRAADFPGYYLQQPTRPSPSDESLELCAYRAQGPADQRSTSADLQRDGSRRHPETCPAC